MALDPKSLRFGPDGLITAIAQDHLTGEVRMVAWMNQEALERTLETGRATFFSRSRGRLWTKGEESGNVLVVKDVFADCDADTLVVLVEPHGPSCHTGRDCCFFEPLTGDPAVRLAQPLLGRLSAVIEARKVSTAEKSYTRSLLEGGPEKVAAKVREEAAEFGVALAGETDERVASEGADVLFHLMVGLAQRGLSVRDVLEVLDRRFGTSGHVEKAARSKS